MSIDTQGAPSYIPLVPVDIPFTDVDKWELTIDGEVIDTVGKDLIGALNSLKNTHGVYAEDYNLPYNIFIRNLSELDHIVDITYTGDTDFSNPLGNPLFGTTSAIVSNNGKTYSFALGGFNAATVWVYPPKLNMGAYTDGGKEKLYALGNAYIIELDGIKYSDPRDLVKDQSFGSLSDVITQNQLDKVLQIRMQANVNGNYHNEQLVNISSQPHTVKVYVDKTKPVGNTNILAGNMIDLYDGKVIYCQDDIFTGSPEFGSVKNRAVSEKGFSMTLAKKSIPHIVAEHSFTDKVDTRLETMVTLSGTASTAVPQGSDQEVPELFISVTIGENVYTPDVTVDGYNYTWELQVSSKSFANVKYYTVMVSRLGELNSHHVNQKHYAIDTISQFTDYDVQALEVSAGVKTLNNSVITIPSAYTAEEITAMKYVSGTRSGTTTKQFAITESNGNLEIKDFVNGWLIDNTDVATGTNMVLEKTIGELGIMQNQQDGTYRLDLVSNAEVSVPTPLYENTQFDYAYVAVTGLKQAVFETSMFSAENAGQCFYIEETDTNLWILRV